MEIIRAKEAYAYSVLAKHNARHIMFDDLVLCFNKFVNEAACKGHTAIVFLWKDFDVNEEIATDEDAITEFLNNVIIAGYDAEFCYISPSAYNPCGIVVAWGENPSEDIRLMFVEHTEIYRGE